MSKHDLRQLKLQERNRISQELRNQKNDRITQNFLETPLYKTAQGVMFFFSMEEEVQTLVMIEDALKQEKKVALPVTNKQSWSIVPGWIQNVQELVPGVWGILQPDPTRLAWVNVNELDVVVVPGVVFDRLGFRIGYGGGFYDRFLARLPPKTWKIGIGFAEQVVDEVPVKSYDQPIDMLITDEENLIFRR